MSHPLPHRQLVKEFMSLGPYLRQEQSEPGRYFLVHRGFPGKAALIFRKKYSESRNP